MRTRLYLNVLRLNCTNLIATDDDYVVERSGVRITASGIIGEGHFGNVYKGVFIDKNDREIPVAVKACKEGADRSTTEKFLEEACK